MAAAAARRARHAAVSAAEDAASAASASVAVEENPAARPPAAAAAVVVVAAAAAADTASRVAVASPAVALAVADPAAPAAAADGRGVEIPVILPEVTAEAFAAMHTMVTETLASMETLWRRVDDLEEKDRLRLRQMVGLDTGLRHVEEMASGIVSSTKLASAPTMHNSRNCPTRSRSFAWT